MSVGMTDNTKDKTDKIALSKAHIELLRSEIARTGAGPQQLMRGLSREKPEGLSSALIRNWAEGRTATAKRHHWDWVLDRYAAYAPDPSLIPLTAEMKSELDAEIRRTQTVPAKLFRTVGEATTPSGLKAHSVRNWLIYPQQSVRESDYNWVMNAYQELPDRPYRIELDPEMLTRIKAEAIRTGASGHSLLKYANGQAPDGLTPVVINRWISGKGATARSDHWAFVMEAYARMPDASRGEQHVKLAERVAIPDEVLEDLQIWRNACLLPTHILRAADVPPGLKPQVISNWLSGMSGTCLPDHLAFIVSRCEAALETPEFRVFVDKATRSDIRANWNKLSQARRAKISKPDCDEIKRILADSTHEIHPAKLLRLRLAISP